jgi:hypothetical protein
MYKYLVYDGYKLVGGTDTFRDAVKMADTVTGRIFDTELGKFCTCRNDMAACAIHGISAQLDRSQME